MKSNYVAAVLLLGTAQMAFAVDNDAKLQSFMAQNVAAWAQAPEIVNAVKAQNAVSGSYASDRIAALDAQWAAEIGAAQTPLIGSVVESAASDFLRARMMDSGGAIYEIFVMDAQGLNVAATGLTSDYWQGDEAKFQDSYGRGANGVHYGAVEFDESSQQYQAQISLSLTDPTTGELIGAMTVGVNPDSLM